MGPWRWYRSNGRVVWCRVVERIGSLAVVWSHHPRIRQLECQWIVPYAVLRARRERTPR